MSRLPGGDMGMFDGLAARVYDQPFRVNVWLPEGRIVCAWEWCETHGWDEWDLASVSAFQVVVQP